MNKAKCELVILIAHFNNLDGLKSSLESIREDFSIDIVIVDDGSKQKPNLEDIKKWYSNGNVTLDLLPKNQGVGIAANRGLEIIKEIGYEFIGRLDCGDKCLPNKYKKQLEHLKKNPDVMLLGTWANMVNEQGELLYVLRHPTNYDEIKREMYLNSTFINPTVVFRSKVLEKIPEYRYEYRHAAQDYAFFFDVIKLYRAENLPEALLDYEISPHAISTKKRKLQVKNRLKIIMSNFKFTPFVVYSLVRNSVLYFMPRGVLENMKKLLDKK